MRSNDMIEIKNVTKIYNRMKKAVDNISVYK